MIKLSNLQKYFFHKKENEIHVLNDINLTLPDKGLVVLLGPSGSGKTTLLNVLGGLDKVKSGTIDFGKESINKYDSKTWDRIRNKQVGYVFQNYNLLTNLTVYDNIALTLNMINIYDKEEIDKRIDYILDAMGMINYRKRRASQLSGGQQQRVAIARALAKNPQVIIADEPTGNLDSKNTQDIMNIIKKISQNKLVVLVTHEEDIANFYGDRIIRLRDGKIVSDNQNGSTGTLDVQHDTDIYLGDLREVSDHQDSTSRFKVFSDEDIEDDVEVRLIVKNKTIYVDVKSKEYRKMQLLENDSEINIYNGKYEKLQRSDFNETDFNLQSIITEKEDSTRHSVISVKDSLKLAVNRLRGASRLGRLFYLAFAGVSILIAISIGMLGGILNMDPAKFLHGSEDAIIFDRATMDYDDIVTLSEHNSVNYFQIVTDVEFEVKLPPLFQAYNQTTTLNRGFVDDDYLDESKIVLGRGIESFNEIVLDNQVADQMINDSRYSYLGITEYADLFKLDLYYELPGIDGAYTVDIKIVGIVEDDSSVIYAKEELALMQQFNVGIYELFQDDITLENGSLIDDDDEMLIYDLDWIESPLALNSHIVFNQTFRATGSYTSDVDVPLYLLRLEDVKEAYFYQRYAQENSDLSFHAKDKEALISYLDSEGIESYDSFAEQLKEYQSNRLANSLGAIIFASVVLAASAISCFFILRSSLLSRIYEVSVYRALGVTKGDIRKMFITEIALITTLTSMVGYIITTYIMYRVQLITETYWDGIHISLLSIVAGIVIIYFVNIVSGLLPVTNLLRKTPAEILSKYDF